MMKFLNSFAIIINSFSPLFSYSYKNNGNENNYIKNNAIQSVVFDGSDVNVILDGVRTKELSFTSHYKKAYVPANQTLLKADNLVYQNEFSGTEDVQNKTGSYKFADFHYNINTRVQDWNELYLDNLYFKNNQISNWQSNSWNSYLKTHCIWKANAKYKDIDAKVEFGSLLNSGNDIVWKSGFNRDFQADGKNYYGINQVKIIESLKVYVFYNFVDRFMWTLNGYDNVNGYSPLLSTDGQVITKSFNTKDLITIHETTRDDNQVFLNLKINDELLFAFNSIAFNQSKILACKQIPNTEKLVEGLKYFYVDQSNYAAAYDFIINNPNPTWEEIEAFVIKNPSQLLKLANKYQLDIDCEGNEIINDIKDQLSFTINYQTIDKNDHETWTNNQIELSYHDLLNGYDIPIYNNLNGDYTFKIDNVATAAYNSDDKYIAPSNTNEINYNPDVIIYEDGIYKIKDNYISEVKFNENDCFDYFPSELDDYMLLNDLLILKDAYGNQIYQFNLPTSNYYLVRDDINGEVYLSATINNKTYYHQFSGFKKLYRNSQLYFTNDESYIASDAAFLKPTDLIDANHDLYWIVNNLDIETVECDDPNGKVRYKINGSKIHNLNLYYQGYEFTVNGFKPYFFRFKEIDEIDNNLDFKNMTNEEFLAYFGEYSDTFYERNFNNFEFKVVANENQTYDVEVIFYDKNGQELKYSKKYLPNNLKLSKGYIVLISAISGGLLILIGIGGWVVWKKLKLKNQKRAHW